MFSGQVKLTIFLSQAGNLGIYDWIMYMWSRFGQMA